MGTIANFDQAREELALVCDVLSPFYLFDPILDDAAREPFETLRAADADALADEWPFLEAKEADELIQALVASARKSTQPELAIDYRRLFVGPNVLACPPYGSVYTDHDCVVFGESTLALRSWLRAHGIKAQDAEREPEDHIGTMLALASYIARQHPEMLKEYLSEHLLTWSSHYLTQLEAAAKGTFYAPLASLTKASLEAAGEVLKLEIDYPHYYR